MRFLFARRCALSFVLAGICMGWGANASADNDEVTLILDWIPDGAYAAFYAGVAEGIYEDEGLDVTIERGYGSSDTVTKIAADVATFGVADIASVMAGRVEGGTPVKAVSSIYTRPPHTIFTLDDSGIEEFADLRGKNLAGAPGSAVRVFLPYVLAQHGLSEDDLNITDADPANMGPLLAARRADAVTGFLTNLPRLQSTAEQAGANVRALEFAETLEMYGNSVIAAEDTISESPELVQRFVRATNAALEFSLENPDTAAEHISEALDGMDPERERLGMDVHNDLTFNSAVAEANPTGYFDAEQLRRTWETVAAAKDYDVNEVDAESFISREFVAGE